jgi:hypothetical protein
MMKMKRFLTTIAGLILVFNAGGQTTFRKELSIGASFGMGVSSVSFVPKVQENQLPGAHAGLTVQWLTETYAGLIFEVNYSQGGWSEHFDDPAFNYTRRLNYIDIPLLSQLYFGNKHVRFFLNVGPKIGFLIGERTTAKVDASPTPPIDLITGKTHVSAQWDMPVENNFAWGICGGPGLEVRTPIGYFQLEGRYYYSLGDVFGSRKADYFSKSSGQIIFGKLTYLIPLKR